MSTMKVVTVVHPSGSTNNIVNDASGNVTVGGSVTSNTITSAAATALTIQSAGTTAITVDTSQNVGIGTNTPVTKLHLASNGAQTPSFAIPDPTNSRYSVGIGSYNVAGVGQRMDFYTGDSGANGTNLGSGALRMSLDVNGNLLVGTTSNYGRLTVSAASGAIAAINASSTNDALMNWTSSGTTKAQSYWNYANDRFYINVGGSGGVYLANGGTSWTSASDERVKNIIEPITDGAAKVSSLRAVIGSYKADPKNTRKAFLIAQDVQSVLPEAVDSSNADELGLQYTDVIPLLVAAIQELKAQNDELKARVATLEAK